MPVRNACRRAIHLCFRTGLSASSTGTLTGTSTSAVNSKWELMLNILLSGKFNFDQFGLLISDCVSADFKLRAHFRNSMQIGMSLKASPEGKR